ncbi:OmpA family protein [bacterium]|nr:OmpA family protein [bacterium]MDB4088264.1 OmpA family protein [Flavobacteriales bacterium]
MNKIFSITLIFFLSLASCQTTAQSSMYDSKSKKAVELYKKGRNEFLNSYGDEAKLNKAENYIRKAIKKDPKFVSAYMIMCEIYLQKKDLNKAIGFKEQGLTINPEYSKNEYYYLAQMQIRAGMYDKCKANASRFLTYKNTNETFQYKCKLLVENCDFAKKAMLEPVDFKPTNLGEAINTENREYFPSLTGDGKKIVFTRIVKDSRAVMTRGRHEDLYEGRTNDLNNWEVSKKFSSQINSLYNEGAPTITADGNFVIFTSCGSEGNYGDGRKGKGSCDLFYSRKLGKKWSKPRNLGAPINTRHWESQPCFSADGRTLYFIRAIISNRGRHNPGVQDIYVTKLSDAGYWSVPKKLSNKINTPGTEESVFIHPDGQTLYFGSNGHPGMGGMDLYLSRMQADGEWGTPENLGYPINTYDNENSIIVAPDGSLAYFASDREGGMGELDLYSFVLPEKAKPFITTFMKGKVYDSESKIPLGATISVIDLKTRKVLLKTKADQINGEYLVNIPTNKELAINVYKTGYFFYSKNFTPSNSKEPILIDIPLDIIKTGDKPYVLENIFFDVSKYSLKQESRVELDKLYQLMKENDKLKIEIGGHTDSDGDDDKNLELSKKRAQSVMNYLLMKGVGVSRLSYKGYGETMPRVKNDSPENKALNRRTEVKIIGEIKE